MTCTGRLLWAGSLTWLLSAAPLVAQEPLLPDVRSSFLPEALATLEEAGFRNIRVAREVMDDMPAGVVLWQYPVPVPPSLTARREPLDRDTEIRLIVVEELPVLPDLRDWRADHALEHVAVLGLDGRVMTQGFDPARSVVVDQAPGPGRIQPPSRVLLEVGPISQETVGVPAIDTVLVSRVDTVRVLRTDTLEVAGPVRAEGVPVYVVGLATLGGLGLGGLAAAGLLARPGGPGRRGPDRGRGDPDEPGPEPDRRDLDAFVPVVVDEAILASAGRVDRAGPGGDGPDRGVVP